MNCNAVANCKQAGLGPITESERKFFRGMYRAQYRRAAVDGLWGRVGCSCGALTLVRYRMGQLVLVPALCGCFSCPLCGVKRAAWLAAQVKASLAANGLRFFWTLTITRHGLHPSVEEQVASHKRVKVLWNNVSTTFRQRNGGAFPYVWVSESTKAGIGHLHILTSYDLAAEAPADVAERVAFVRTHWRIKIPEGYQEWMPEMWAMAEMSRLLYQATDGDTYVCDVQPVSSDRASSYVAKYVMQQVAQRPVELRGSRVYSKARSVQFEPFRQESDSPGEWQRWNKPYWEAVELVARTDVCEESRVAGSPIAIYKDTAGTIAGIPAVCVSQVEYGVSWPVGPPCSS